MSLAPDIAGVDVFSRLNVRLREVVQQEHLNNCSGVETFTVIGVSPLRIEDMQGDLILEDGDPDFIVGAWARQYILQYPLVVGDQVKVLRTAPGPEWHLVDVSDPGGQARIGP